MVFIGITGELLEHIGQPLQLVDTYDLTTFKQGVEHGIVFGAAIGIVIYSVAVGLYRSVIVFQLRSRNGAGPRSFVIIE